MLRVLGGLLGLMSFTTLFSVVTWYRNEEVPGSAFFLAISTTLAFVVGAEISLLFVVPRAGAVVLGVGVFFGLPVRILVYALLFAVLIAIGRRFRGVFAPDTIGETQSPSSAGAP